MIHRAVPYAIVHAGDLAWEERPSVGSDGACAGPPTSRRRPGSQQSRARLWRLPPGTRGRRHRRGRPGGGVRRPRGDADDPARRPARAVRARHAASVAAVAARHAAPAAERERRRDRRLRLRRSPGHRQARAPGRRRARRRLDGLSARPAAAMAVGLGEDEVAVLLVDEDHVAGDEVALEQPHARAGSRAAAGSRA